MLNPNTESCTAKSKRSGERCKNPPAFNQKVCRLHGAKSLSGKLHPNYRNGRYSKYLPANLLQRFEDSLTDESALELGEEMALLTARIGELLEALSTSTNDRKNRVLWSEISDLIEHRRRLVLTNITRLRVEMHFVPLRDVLTMIDFLTATIREATAGMAGGQEVLLKLHSASKKMFGEIERKSFK